MSWLWWQRPPPFPAHPGTVTSSPAPALTLPCAVGPDPARGTAQGAAARAEEKEGEEPPQRSAKQWGCSCRAWSGSFLLNLAPHLLFASVRGKISPRQQVHLYSIQCLSQKENCMKITLCVGLRITQNSFNNSQSPRNQWEIQRECNATSCFQITVLYNKRNNT